MNQDHRSGSKTLLFLRAKPLHIGLSWVLLAALAACSNPQATAFGGVGQAGQKVTEADPNTQGATAEGHTEASHGKGAKPNDALVFPQASVNEFRIDISAADWAAMENNMRQIYGERGQGGGPGNGPGMARPEGMASGSFPGEARPPRPEPGASQAGAGRFSGMDPGASGPFSGGPPPWGDAPASGGMMGGPGPMGPSENPMWVQGTVRYQGKAWPHVGIRFKGNSSLSSAWRSGSNRIPFKLDFDQWEKEYPAVLDQRFWGHKQLALSTNFSDPTGMRESLAYGLLEQMGLPSAKTGFYELVLNHGGVVERLGLYTAVEVVDDTAIKRHFGQDKGNIYEGDGAAVSLALGTREQIPNAFQKENNKNSDWGDVQALYDSLHAPERHSNPAAWRAQLEARFNVDDFLKWLALAAALQHWDTYGAMAHNFYLYHRTDVDRLEWISWDHNLILSAMGGRNGAPGGPPGGAPGMPAPDGNMGMFPPNGMMPPEGMLPPDARASGPMAPAGDRPGGEMGRVAFDRSSTSERWPLIAFLMKDPVYLAKYQSHLRALSQHGFTQAELEAKVASYTAVLAPTMARSSSGSSEDFTQAVAGLKQAIAKQVEGLAAHLKAQAP